MLQHYRDLAKDVTMLGTLRRVEDLVRGVSADSIPEAA
jgi:hypothetical protein